MSKEAFERGFGRKFEPADSTWKPRKGKTKRDHESGAWANHLANKASTALANRSGPTPQFRKRSR